MSFPRIFSLLLLLVGGFALTYERPASPMPALVPSAMAKDPTPPAPPTPPTPEAPYVKLSDMVPIPAAHDSVNSCNRDAEFLGQILSAHFSGGRELIPGTKGRRATTNDFLCLLIRQLCMRMGFSSGVSSFPVPILSVVSECSQNKVFWIYAQTVVADVHDHTTLGNFAKGETIRDTMRSIASSIFPRELSISRATRLALPQPTFANFSLFNPSPESPWHGNPREFFTSMPITSALNTAKFSASPACSAWNRSETFSTKETATRNSCRWSRQDDSPVTVGSDNEYFAVKLTRAGNNSQAGNDKREDPPAPVPFVKLPATKKGVPQRNIYLCPDTNCPSVKWIIPAGLEQDTEVQLRHKLAIAVFGDAGTYTVQAYGALGDQASDVAACVVTIGTPPPPTPPTPPTPPVPPDPLTASLQAAFNLDKDTDRAMSLAFLQQVYAGMASQAASWSDVKTNADALAKIKAVVQAPIVGLSATQVVNLRKAIAADFTAKFGTTGTTPIALTALAAELKNVATALSGAK